MQRAAWTVLAVVVLALGAAPVAQAETSPQLLAARAVTLAAARGDAKAQTRLGFMFERGIGVPQNYDQAAQWYHRAAEQGDPRGQFHLGLLFSKGFGVPSDFLLAYKWLNLAASRVGNAEREYYVRIRDAVATKLSLAEIEEAQWWTIHWVPKRYR
jgi:TPR repeat protein